MTYVFFKNYYYFSFLIIKQLAYGAAILTLGLKKERQKMFKTSKYLPTQYLLIRIIVNEAAVKISRARLPFLVCLTQF